VIDTQRNFLSQGNAQRLAAALQGQYLYLPGASGGAIAAAATAAANAAAGHAASAAADLRGRGSRSA
jgi:hypothetical protein